MKRGEIWMVAVAAPDAAAAARPCVVVSPTELNAHLGTVLVAPLSGSSLAAPFRVPVTHAGQRGLILLEQIQAVDTGRLTTRLGALSNTTLAKALAVLREFFAD